MSFTKKIKKYIILLVLSGDALSLCAQSEYMRELSVGYGSDKNFMADFSYSRFLGESMLIGLGAGLNSPIKSYEFNGLEGDVFILSMTTKFQYIPWRKKCSPFAALQAGGENTILTRWIDSEGNKIERDYKLVGVLSPVAGVKYKATDKITFTIAFALSFRTSSTYSVSKQNYSFLIGIGF
ncbi:MAG: hypothetical protein LBL58_07435 [Tannerellaceae bacterium]|nr:hypothetical protein [Tannerellaceae bacterium]